MAPSASPALARYYPGISLTGEVFSRSSTATFKDISGARQTAPAGQKRDAHYIAGVRTTLLEGASTNHFLNSAAPATQTSPSLGTGVYTLWMEGTGSIAVAQTTATITGAGTASSGVNVTFTVTVAGTVTYTVTGSPTLAQAENYAVASSYIPTVGASVTRSADRYYFPFTAPPQESTFYAKFVNIGTTGTINQRLFELATLGTDADPRILVYANSVGSLSGFYNVPSGGGNTSATPGFVLGDTIEVRLPLSRTGVIRLGSSVNGGTETLAAASGALALPATWGVAPVFSLNCDGAGGQSGNAAFVALKVLSGTRTLAELRVL